MDVDTPDLLSFCRAMYGVLVDTHRLCDDAKDGLAQCLECLTLTEPVDRPYAVPIVGTVTQTLYPIKPIPVMYAMELVVSMCLRGKICDVVPTRIKRPEKVNSIEVTVDNHIFYMTDDGFIHDCYVDLSPPVMGDLLPYHDLPDHIRNSFPVLLIPPKK